MENDGTGRRDREAGTEARMGKLAAASATLRKLWVARVHYGLCHGRSCYWLERSRPDLRDEAATAVRAAVQGLHGGGFFVADIEGDAVEETARRTFDAGGPWRGSMLGSTP